MTPLVNVVLLLLLFFLLGSSLVLQPGVAGSLPTAGVGRPVPALAESVGVGGQPRRPRPNPQIPNPNPNAIYTGYLLARAAS